MSSIVTCPLDVVKTRLQNQGKGHPGIALYRGTYGMAEIYFLVVFDPDKSDRDITCRLGLDADKRSFFILLLGTLSRIWEEEGIRGLYRGLGPTIFGYLPTWAIYFTVYDYCKVRMGGRIGKPDDHWLVHILSAMTAGATSTTMTNPLWVIKTRFMVSQFEIGLQKNTHTL